MFKIYCTIIALLLTVVSYGQTNSKELNIIVNQKGISYNKPPMRIFWFMESRETECYRLFWFKDKFPTPLRGKLHYWHKRVDIIMKYDDFYMIALVDNHKGRNSVLILINNDFEVIEEYVFMSGKRNKYRIIKKKIKSGKLKTKAKFLEDIEEFEKTIPK